MEKNIFAVREQVARNQLIEETKAAKRRLKLELAETSKAFQIQLESAEKKIAKSREIENKFDAESLASFQTQIKNLK